jgi:hypothetical protein
MRDILCAAIISRHLVEFSYEGGVRIVEPHMVAANELGHYALSGWFLAGLSNSGTPGWREYLLTKISNLRLRDETFSGPRSGCNPSGGSKFPSVYCRL